MGIPACINRQEAPCDHLSYRIEEGLYSSFLLSGQETIASFMVLGMRLGRRVKGRRVKDGKVNLHFIHI